MSEEVHMYQHMCVDTAAGEGRHREGKGDGYAGSIVMLTVRVFVTHGLT